MPDCRDACYTTQPVELLSLTNNGTYNYNRVSSYTLRDGQTPAQLTLAQRLSEEGGLDNHESSYSSDSPAGSFANGNFTKHSKGLDTDMQEKQTAHEEGA